MKPAGTTRATEAVLQRFDELILQGEKLKEECRRLYFSGSKRSIDPEGFEAWRTHCLSLLTSTFGSSGVHVDSFVNRKFFDYYNSTQIYLGILKGAREDLRRGYFFHKDLMLSAGIFDSLIERSRRQLKRGRVREARGVLQVVLAEILAKICDNKNVPYRAEDSAEALVGRLAEAEALPAEVAEQLGQLFVVFSDVSDDRRGLEESLARLLAFLDDYLASRIMILN